MYLLFTLIYHFDNHTMIDVEVLNPVNLMRMENTLITIKILRFGIVFVNVHGICIRIVQQNEMIFSLRQTLYVTASACECP